MLEHDPQTREIAAELREVLLQEHALSVEHVDLRVGDLSVQQEGEVDALHLGDRLADATPVGDAVL